tara:strand:+ start:732 stop:914 length:183 start_codon:yes stop_codon:yes gene_type:complete
VRETAGVGLETMWTGVEVPFSKIRRSIVREVAELPDLLLREMQSMMQDGGRMVGGHGRHV